MENPRTDLGVLERAGFRREHMSGLLTAMSLHVSFGSRATLLQVGGADDNLIGSAKAFRAVCRMPIGDEEHLELVTTDLRDVAALGDHLKRLAAAISGDMRERRMAAAAIYERDGSPVTWPFAGEEGESWHGARRAGAVVLSSPASVHGDDYLRWRDGAFPASEPAIEAPAP